MRTLTPTDQQLLAARHGQEFWYCLEIEWPDGLEVYSNRKEDGVLPLLLSITDFNNVSRVDGFGSTAAIDIELNDAYGNFKYRFDTLDLTNVRATVVLRSDTLYIRMFTGRIEHPITWTESTRTLKFTVAPAFNDGLVGYTPNMQDIEASSAYGFDFQSLVTYMDFGFSYDDTFFISSEFFRTKERLNGESWPTVFGYCRNVPIAPIAKSPACHTTREVWDITGGWAARSKAIQINKDAQEYNNQNTIEILNDEIDPKPYVVVPRADGIITMQTDRSDLFEQFETLLVSVEFNDQLIVCRGRFYTTIQPQHLDATPFAPKGYFVVTVGPEADELPLLDIVNPDYDPGDPTSPPTIPDPSHPPTGWPIDMPDNLDTYTDFNIPVYENIRVFQQLESDDYEVASQDWPIPMTMEQKQEILYRSLAAKTLEKLPSYLATDVWGSEQLTEILDGSPLGYPEDQLTRFHVVGLLDDAGVTAKSIPDYFAVEDYPWLAQSWIEAEVILGTRKPSLDPSLDTSTIADLVEWNDDGEIGYILLPVIKQRGFECTVYNPDQFTFRRIRTVYKNNVIQKKRQELATISADKLLSRDPESRQGVIPSGAIIRFFDWLPEQQFVIDTKMGTDICAIKYLNEEGDDYIALPSGSYGVTDAESGTLWAGWHPTCTVVTLSYNGMMRHRFDCQRNNGKLVCDSVNVYQTDEEIAQVATQIVNGLPDSNLFEPIVFETDLAQARPNSCILTEPVGIKTFLSQVAFQNGKIVAGVGNEVRYVNIMKPPRPVMIIDENKIVEKSVMLDFTTDVATVFDLQFRSSDMNDDIYQTIQRMNLAKYGEQKIQWLFYVYDDINMSIDVVNFWMYYFSNYWRRMSLTVTFECAGIEVADIVRMQFKQPLTFSTPYSQVSGEVSGSVTQSQLYNSLGLVESMKFDVNKGTIDIVVWTPIMCGNTVPDVNLWRQR